MTAALAIVAVMTRKNRPPSRPPVRYAPPAPRTVAAPPPLPGRSTKAPANRAARSWRRDQQRGLIVAVSLTLGLGCLLIGYGVRAQMVAEAGRAASRAQQVALATKEELRNGAILFVPVYGNVCRQRWIDNATWTVRDGEDVLCDEAASWNVNAPVTDHSVALRMDAVRGGFSATAKPAD